MARLFISKYYVTEHRPASHPAKNPAMQKKDLAGFLAGWSAGRGCSDVRGVSFSSNYLKNCFRASLRVGCKSGDWPVKI